MSSQTQSPSPSPLASVSLPTSSSTVNVSILNTTARIDRLPTSYHYPPSHIPAPFTHLNCPCFAFLIEHPPSGQRVLFDLGMRKDWQNLAPSIVSMIKTVGADIRVEKDVSEILEAGGIDLKDIDGIIWRNFSLFFFRISDQEKNVMKTPTHETTHTKTTLQPSHHHCDHTGSPTLFPLSTKLYVGPGFQAAFTPGHPTNASSPILDSDYTGRELHEITFSASSPVVAGFRAYDFFGDGSFYLLDAPGHSEAHMCGLARTTAATINREEREEQGDGQRMGESYILLGADTAHHPAELRPSPSLPLPPSNPLSRVHRLAPSPQAFISPFLVCKDEVTHNVAETAETIRKVQALDAREDVLVVMAHDQSLVDVVRFWPESANAWRREGWKGRGCGGGCGILEGRGSEYGGERGGDRGDILWGSFEGKEALTCGRSQHYQFPYFIPRRAASTRRRRLRKGPDFTAHKASEHRKGNLDA
ncbi:hypothetical protein G7Y79_00053g088220 [Physcia stellaris]|nr:hypothetical protein G7Y79_00053g088220 [Physcia stellaris]